MSGVSRSWWWFFVAAVTCVGACVENEPECYDARTVLLTAIEAVEGEVAFQTESGKSIYPLVTPSVSGELPEGTCSAEISEGTVYEDREHDLGLTDDLGAIVEFRCHMDQPPLFRDFHVIASFADVRLLDPTEPALGDSVSCQSCPYLGEGCAHYSDPLLRAEVLETTGAPAPYPQLVTSDFARTIRVELEMGRVGDGDDGVCTENIELKASATFTLTQARYQASGITQMCAL
jgi:hypothetical protein